MTATLNATLNPNGAEVTECKFEYGTSIADTQSAPCSPAPGVKIWRYYRFRPAALADGSGLAAPIAAEASKTLP
jgi:hypothetical protein